MPVQVSRNPRSGLSATVLAAAAVFALSPGRGQAGAGRWDPLAEPVFQLVAVHSQLFPGPSGAPYTEVPISIAQDGDGFLWIGTDAGLERWDGYRFHTYTAGDGQRCAVPADDIWALHTDTKGALWVGTLGGGLARYDRDTDCFEGVPAGADGLIDPTIKSIADDGEGALWVGSAGGLDHFDPDHWRVAHFAGGTDDDRLLGGGVYNVLRDRDGALWVSTARGLLHRGAGRSHFTRLPLPAPSAVPSSTLQGSDGRIWIGTLEHGAYVIDPRTLVARTVLDARHFKGFGAVVDAAETPNGEIWFATHGSGILAVDPATLRTRLIRHRAAVPTSLPDDTVERIYRDRSGLMWIVGWRGIGYFRAQQAITSIPILVTGAVTDASADDVKAVAVMQDGRVALGLGRGGVVVVDPGRSGVQALSPVSAGSRIVPSLDGVTALATSDGRDLFAFIVPAGLVWFDADARRSAVVPLPGRKHVAAVQALLAERQRLWVGGIDGVWMLTRRASPVAPSPVPWDVVDRLELPRVWAICASPEGTMWFGVTDGLFRFDPASHAVSRIRFAAAAHGARSDPFVSSLLFDKRGRLWVGTTSQGIFVVDPSATHADAVVPERHIDEGLPSKSVDKLIADANGDVWVSTDRGVARIEPSSFAVRAFDRGDGLAISDYWIGSGASTDQGELLFGGTGGLTVVRPDRVDRSPYHPPVVIASVTVGHRTMPSGLYNGAEATLRIPAEARSFSVEFAALDYAEPDRNTYAYKLDGYDRDWVRTGSDSRSAAYTNLAPGEYRLRLRGTDHAGNWSLSDKVVSISVAAAWYQTLWFHLTEALAAIALVTAIVRSRTIVLRARQRELQSLVDRRTAELAGAAEERRALIENLAHDLRAPLTSLSGYLETLKLKDASLAVDERQTHLTVAFRQTERLTRLVRELFDLVRLEGARVALSREQFQPVDLVQDVIQEFGPMAAGRRINFELGVDADRLSIVGDLGLMQRMVDNLLSNAVRHTPVGGAITVRLAADGQWLQLDVSDTGRGIERSEIGQIFDRYKRGGGGEGRPRGGAGLGLAIVKKIVELHGGTIEAHSEVGVGTRFSVRLPLASSAAAIGFRKGKPS